MKRGMRLVLDTFGRIDGLVYVTDEIGDNLRTTNSTGNVEKSLVRAIEKTQTVSCIYGEQQADFRLFYSSQNPLAAPQSAINRAAMSEFLSSRARYIARRCRNFCLLFRQCEPGCQSCASLAK